MAKKLLNVPYKSQGDPDAPDRNDCGPTSVAMILAAIGKPTPTNQVYEKTGATGGLIGTSQLQLAADKFGLTLMRFKGDQATAMQKLRAFVDQGLACIALIKYAYLPGRQVDFSDGHFVVVVGYDDVAKQVFVNDPLYLGARRQEGAYRPHTEADWMKAWGGCIEDGNNPYVLLVSGTAAPFVAENVDLPMARRRVFSRLAYDGKSDYNGKPFSQLENSVIAQLATEWSDWPAAVDEYTVQAGEGRRQISGKVYGTWKRWAVLQYFNDMADADEPAPGTVLKVPRARAYVQPAVTRWKGLKVRPLPVADDKVQPLESIPANSPVTLLSVPLTILSVSGDQVQTEPWLNQPGDVWARVRSPFGQEGWARWRYAKDNEIYLAYKQPVFSKPLWGAGKCLAGIGTANPWPLEPDDYGVIDTANLELVKLLSPSHEAPGQGGDIAQRLKHQGCFVLGRLFEKPAKWAVLKPVDQFLSSVMDGFEELYQAGVRYFEVHNEPNLRYNQEGLGVNWNTGAEFGEWFVAVCDKLRARHADVKLGYPGLSPQYGEPPAGDVWFRDIWKFLDEGEFAVQKADWIGVHCYWQGRGSGHWGMLSEDGGMLWKKFRARWPNKLLFITEFSNNNPNVSYTDKGKQYAEYYSLLRRESNLAGAAAFALYWPGGQDKNREGWRTDQGGVNDIAAQVGSVVGVAGF